MEEETIEQRELQLAMLTGGKRAIMPHQGMGLVNYFVNASGHISRKYVVCTA